MIEELKDWQHGIPIEILKALEDCYAPYNQYTDSPFVRYKKNNIAEDLHEDVLKVVRDSAGKYVAVTRCDVSRRRRT